jgi:AcrR family transcriptional regulator
MMPYTTAHKMRTRERILDSARRSFTRAGYENVTIDDVMAHAGLTRGGFYNHFSNKADLFAAAVETYARRVALGSCRRGQCRSLR